MYGIAIDVNKINKILKDFYALTNIRIAFCRYDYREIITEPKNLCEFCNALRVDPLSEAKCHRCDEEAFETARLSRSLNVYECHAGLIEAICPIIYDDKILGYLMMGQTLTHEPDEKLWNKMKNTHGYLDYDVDENELKNAFLKLNYMSKEEIDSAANIMTICAKYVYISDYIKIYDTPIIQKIKDFIEDKLDDEVTISDLAKHLNLSKSYLSHVIKAELNSTFTKVMAGKRVDKAKYLLKNTDKKVKDVAILSGFEDVNYFCRLFKKVSGVTPESYRKQGLNS